MVMRMRRFLFVLALLATMISSPLGAVGTVTVTTADAGNGVTLYTVAWTSTAGGAVSGNAFAVKRGHLKQIKFVPNSAGTQPTDLYDVTLVDENSIDVLNSQGANLSNSAGLYLQFDPPLWHDADNDLDLVVANAGNAKGGTVYLWVQ